MPTSFESRRGLSGQSCLSTFPGFLLGWLWNGIAEARPRGRIQRYRIRATCCQIHEHARERNCPGSKHGPQHSCRACALPARQEPRPPQLVTRSSRPDPRHDGVAGNGLGSQSYLRNASGTIKNHRGRESPVQGPEARYRSRFAFEKAQGRALFSPATRFLSLGRLSAAYSTGSNPWIANNDSTR